MHKLDIPRLVSLTSVGNYNSHDSQTECLLVLLANSWSCIPIISGGNKTGKAAIDLSNIYVPLNIIAALNIYIFLDTGGIWCKCDYAKPCWRKTFPECWTAGIHHVFTLLGSGGDMYVTGIPGCEVNKTTKRVSINWLWYSNCSQNRALLMLYIIYAALWFMHICVVDYVILWVEDVPPVNRQWVLS